MLTDAIIRNAKPRKTDYQLYDIQGLSINITPAGTKSFKFRIMKKGKRCNLTLGQYPFLSLKEARQLAEDKRFLYKNDLIHDPSESLDSDALASSQAPIFSEFAEHWKSWKFGKLYGDEVSSITAKRQSTCKQIDRALKNDINPVIGDLPLDLITKKHTLLIQQNIESRDALSVAEKVRAWFNEMFRLAIAEGIIDTNPAADLDMLARGSRRTKHNPFLTLEELPALFEAFSHYKGLQQTLLGIKLLLLTGVRTGELRAAKPEQFDLAKGIWCVPPENLKQINKLIRTGAHKSEIPPYIVPLSTQAQEVVKKLISSRYPSQSYLLCHRYHPELMVSENTLNSALIRMGYKDRLTGHGIRATISTALHEMQYEHQWIEAQLSHSDKDKDSVSTTYNHAMYIEQRKKMMQDWANKLNELGMC
ncbi:tyrosine-type recombinase/integrase [Entomomonas asaccharolytica]|uniref:Tyrosine-type recombinase/integrase n=1 Tax=Entomomonas asaccharolytica TaxID=2785331 RepID=A0A974NFY0_9GAMM|nr:tyrosine-type recombinase/integrase [Entomomonas asaccharolytica]QQP86055.1 tyrosine-type recombinase/integrase [Entomomonas asaccharolytica]